MSWLGRAAGLSLAVAVVTFAVESVWNDAPSWLGFGASALFFNLGVVLVALWTVVRLFGTSARLRRRDVWDDRDRPI